VTIPDHPDLRVGTLRSVLRDIASYLDMDIDLLTQRLFHE